MPENLIADMNDTTTNTVTRNASQRSQSVFVGSDNDTLMKKLLESQDKHDDPLQAMDTDNVDFDSISMIDHSANFSTGKQKVVCCHLFGYVCDQSC